MIVRRLFATALLTALFLARPAAALDPLPDVYYGSGYISWTLPADAKLWAMEKLLEGLRNPDLKERQKVMKAVGFEKIRVRRQLLWPEIDQPMVVETRWLGIERRKEAILTLPVRGRHAWVMIVFRQDANDETYWRPFQFLKFDAEPVQGIEVSYPDILGDQTYLIRVKHLSKNDIYGTRRVDSIFKFDEKQLRLAYQEIDNFYRQGKFQGDPTKIEQKLTFKGDQRILRELEIKTYPFMPAPEFYKYEESNVSPRKVLKAKESFSWNPQNFSFYDPIAELEKLVGNKSAFVRREAARRLGEIVKTSHPQLEGAMLKDKDAYVRAQVALALENIGDPSALPALDKALHHYDEPENLEEAYRRAFDTLTKIKAEAPSKRASRKKNNAGTSTSSTPEALSPMTPEGPKIKEKK